MYPFKKLAFVAAALILHSSLFSQDKLNFKFGTVKKEDFDVKSPLIDSGTNAIVIADLGKSEFTSNPTDLSFSLIYKHKKRMKILNKNGFEAATVIIPLYVSSSGNSAEKIQELKAYTYNLEDGKVVETKLDKDQVFSEKYNKNRINKKFTFPALKEGSIIEFSYEVKSDFYFNFQPWAFQGEYPVLWSQYEAAIPEFYKYIITTQGYHAYDVNKNEQSSVKYRFIEHVEREGGMTSGGSGLNSFDIDGNLDYHTWIMKNVPGLKEEPFTTTIRNSISKIEFQLQQVAFRGSLPKNYTNSWEKLSSELLEDENFGYQINRPNNWLDDDMKAIVGGETNKREKARKIYEFIRKNFTCTSYDNFMCNGNIKDVFKNKNGSVADINLLLIAMLRSEKIDVEPVLLSTRENGVVNPYYPLIDKFNYVIARVDIDGEIIYLDASRKVLPFGKLPSQVYNGHARIINKMAPAVYFEPDSLHESATTSVFISNEDKGGIGGFYKNVYGTYGAMELRNNIFKQTLAEYKKSVQDAYHEDIEVSNILVDSLNQPDMPLTLQFEMKLKAFGESDIVYFNPLMQDGLSKNPFTSAERFYPVEMPYTKKTTYLLNMEIPTGYKVEELPKSTRVSLNENDGMFEYLISSDGKYIQMKCLLDIKTATFTNEDYQTLRDFYGFVVKKEAEQIVFKKIK